MNIPRILRAVWAPTARPLNSRPLPALIVEANDRGGYHLRWAGTKAGFGNYATEVDALRIARYNFAEVRVLTAAEATVEQPQLVTAQ